MMRRLIAAAHLLGVPRRFLGAERIGDWMQTRSGLAYYPLDPRVSEVRIEDVAFSLANQCRFAGHVEFYSVAEHSVLCSYVVPREHAFAALMHDAAEAYTLDIHRPLKRWLWGYGRIEALNWRAIAQAFGLPFELDSCVKLADDAVCLAEKAALLGRTPKPWTIPGEPANVMIERLPPARARALFLQRYFEIAPQFAAERLAASIYAKHGVPTARRATQGGQG